MLIVTVTAAECLYLLLAWHEKHNHNNADSIGLKVIHHKEDGALHLINF